MNDSDPRYQFLAAIKADPDDDAPRLQYADWLEENGDPDRAEFIRVQCELAGFHKHERALEAQTGYIVGFGGGRVGHCRRRERELFAKYGTDWLADFFGKYATFTNVKMVRGFPEVIACTWDDCQKHLDVIVAEYPIREVNLITPISVFAHTQDNGKYAILLDQAGAMGRLVNPESFDVVRVVDEILAKRWPGVTFNRQFQNSWGRPPVGANPNDDFRRLIERDGYRTLWGFDRAPAIIEPPIYHDTV